MVALSPRIMTTLAKIKNSKPTLLLQEARQLNATAFRVVASFAPIGKQPITANDLSEMVLTATDGQFRLIADTATPLDKVHDQCVVAMIVEANTQVREYDEAFIKDKCRALAKNLFSDNEDKIWQVVDAGENKMLVQSVREDFAKLISSRLARKTNQIVSSISYQASYAGMLPANGDYICYYNPERQMLAWGFALATVRANEGDLNVFDRTERKLVPISTASVIPSRVVEGNSLDKKHSLLNYIQSNMNTRVLAEDITPAAMSNILDYMRMLYADTDYFDELEDLVSLRNKTDVGSLTLNHD